jgi:hypothetical protein
MANEQAKPAKKEKRFIINVALGNDNEPSDIFVGANGTDFRIRRGKDVNVPASVLEILDNAVMGVQETDSDDPTKSTIVERKRFPYTIVAEAA